MDIAGFPAAEGLEAALRASLEVDGAARGPPPAARAAVKALVREKMNAERLAQLGEGVQCSVCRCGSTGILGRNTVCHAAFFRMPQRMLAQEPKAHVEYLILCQQWTMQTSLVCRRREELIEGDEVQLMPCNEHHVYHPACLAPWLAEHNSCPVCRHELPTDDQKYEKRKQQAATEAEERRGAENALTHNEFMYT